ncbi:MAG: hypothetical protein Q8O36_02550 [Candidatus Omnitrophota bacterium]|nr:hypothetical protein [Candidatus Omnitrophota bacterium]
MRNGVFKSVTILVLLIGMIYLVGCAGIEPPTPKEILSHPLGTSMLRVGLTKDRILAQWGDPDLKEYDNTGKWDNAKEKWTYYARYGEVPVNAGYLSKTQYLYFDGNYLVKFTE